MAVILSRGLLVTLVGGLTFGQLPVTSGHKARDQHVETGGEACETEDAVSLLMRGSSPSVRTGSSEELSMDVQRRSSEVILPSDTDPQTRRPGVGLTSEPSDSSASGGWFTKGGWSDLEPMSHGASDVSVAKVGTEIVVALGWEDGGDDGKGGCGTARTRIYDLKSGSWRAGCDAPMANYGAGAASYRNQLYAAGGWLAPQAFWEYHLRTDTWRELPSIPTGRIHAAAVAFGRAIWVIGGWLMPSKEVCAVVESYSMRERKWAAAPYLKIAVGAAVATEFHGKMYVFGGYGRGDVATDAVQIYDPSGKDWSTEAAKMPTPRGYASLGVVGGKMFIIGGWNDCARAEVEAYDPSKNIWDVNYKSMTAACAFAGGDSYKDKVYIFGGSQESHMSNISVPLSTTSAFLPWSHQ